MSFIGKRSARFVRSLICSAYARKSCLPITIAVVAMTALSIGACPAEPATHTGRDLVEACRRVTNHSQPSPSDNEDDGVCVGEIEALNWLAPGEIEFSLRSCVPDAVSVSQMAQAVVTFIDGNHDRANEPFEGLALEGLALKWPCARKDDGWLHRLFGGSE